MSKAPRRRASTPLRWEFLEARELLSGAAPSSGSYADFGGDATVASRTLPLPPPAYVVLAAFETGARTPEGSVGPMVETVAWSSRPDPHVGGFAFEHRNGGPDQGSFHTWGSADQVPGPPVFLLQRAARFGEGGPNLHPRFAAASEYGSALDALAPIRGLVSMMSMPNKFSAHLDPSAMEGQTSPYDSSASQGSDEPPGGAEHYAPAPSVRLEAAWLRVNPFARGDSGETSPNAPAIVVPLPVVRYSALPTATPSNGPAPAALPEIGRAVAPIVSLEHRAGDPSPLAPQLVGRLDGPSPHARAFVGESLVDPIVIAAPDVARDPSGAPATSPPTPSRAETTVASAPVAAPASVEVDLVAGLLNYEARSMIGSLEGLLDDFDRLEDSLGPESGLGGPWTPLLAAGATALAAWLHDRRRRRSARGRRGTPIEAISSDHVFS